MFIGTRKTFIRLTSQSPWLWCQLWIPINFCNVFKGEWYIPSIDFWVDSGKYRASYVSVVLCRRWQQFAKACVELVSRAADSICTFWNTAHPWTGESCSRSQNRLACPPWTSQPGPSSGHRQGRHHGFQMSRFEVVGKIVGWNSIISSFWTEWLWRSSPSSCWYRDA